MEGRRVSETEYSRRLPPPEAWKHPSRWLDISTGLVKRDAPRLVLPTDDRGLLRPDEVVEIVNDMFFWSDYDWPYDPSDPETAPDDHHFYFTAREYKADANKGSYIPQHFRELPTHIGLMPRQFHNTIHDLTRKPTMPSLEVMREYNDSYQLAYQAFRHMIDSARKTVRTSSQIGERRRAFNEGRILSTGDEDQIALEFLQSFFAKHFEVYSQSVNAWRDIAPQQAAILDIPELGSYKPHVVMRKFGSVATRRHINYVPILQAA